MLDAQIITTSSTQTGQMGKRQKCENHHRILPNIKLYHGNDVYCMYFKGKAEVLPCSHATIQTLTIWGSC